MASVKISYDLYYGLHPSIVLPSYKVDFYIDLTTEKEFPDFIVPENCTYKRFPIEDRKVPSNNQLKEIINYIENNKGVFYIFCKGGHGRSGTIVSIIYGIRNNLFGSEAMKHINTEWKKQRDMSKIRLNIKKLGSPQTKKQKDFVSKYLDSLDKFRGSLIGVFLGDALGAPHEFRFQTDKYTGILEYKSKIRFRFQKEAKYMEIGQMTDDSEMTLIILRNMLNIDNFQEKQILDYIEWANSNPCGIGKNTSYLFKNIKAKDPNRRIKTYKTRYGGNKDIKNSNIKKGFAGDMKYWTQSNGSLMRITPLAFFNLKDLIEIDTKITNPHPVNIEINLLYSEFMIDAKNNIDKLESYEKIQNIAKEETVKQCFSDIITDFNSTSNIINNINKQKGWVINSFYISILAYLKFDNMVDMYQFVIGSGGDTDTNAAIAGGLLGARLGYNCIYKQCKNNIDLLFNTDTSKGDYPRPEKYTLHDFYELSKTVFNNI